MNRSPARTRQLLAREAARLMYEEGVDQYFTAKRMAAKRLFGPGGGRRLQFRPVDLPSNGEIQAALLRLAESTEGDRRTERLGAMRLCALGVMDALAAFAPRLIGSVSTGHIRRGSDIDLHVFSDDPDAPETHLSSLGWIYEKRIVEIRRQGAWHTYLHLCVDAEFPVELTVYPRAELQRRPRSSTDGRPIDRLSVHDVRTLIRDEHPELANTPIHVHL
ncbi:MAG: nucleotide-binding enzyme [Myxococcales bacterium]|nr:nucleotide-binding enzyme [Myxococcales bacterium]